eukprot:scaffold1021_cov108-Isochrysis_galbana.AAC.14
MAATWDVLPGAWLGPPPAPRARQALPHRCRAVAAALAAASAIWPTAPALAGGRAADVASTSGLAANSGALGLTAGAAGVPCPPNTPRTPAPLPSTAAVEKGIDGDGAAENGMYGAVEKRPAEERLAENVELVLPKTNPKFGAPAGGVGGSGRGWMGTVSIPSSVLKSLAGLAGASPGLKGEGDFDEYSLIGDAVASESASDAVASKSASGRRRASVASCGDAISDPPEVFPRWAAAADGGRGEGGSRRRVADAGPRARACPALDGLGFGREP